LQALFPLRTLSDYLPRELMRILSKSGNQSIKGLLPLNLVVQKTRVIASISLRSMKQIGWSSPDSIPPLVIRKPTNSYAEILMDVNLEEIQDRVK